MNVAFFSNVTNAFNNNTKNTVAIYWGQNSMAYVSTNKQKEKSLKNYCDESSLDIIMLAFVNQFPGIYNEQYGTNLPTILFPFHTNSLFSAEKPVEMKDISKDIIYCQAQNKKIILSLGGELGNYSLNSTWQATEFAATMWHLFGPTNETYLATTENTNKTLPRPFGDAVIDGFDFDFESTTANDQYSAFIEQLQKYTNLSSKNFIFTAVPQCPYPDKNLDTVLSKNHLDMVFIQFYNNYCVASGNNTEFNWDTWVKYANTTSLNKDIKLFLGLPGSINSSSSGYISTSAELTSIIKGIQDSAHFGGVMLWEASMSFANILTDSKKSYPDTIRDILSKNVDNTTASNTPNKSFGKMTDINCLFLIFIFLFHLLVL